MPLDKSKTKTAFSRNVSELVRSGRPQKQALAIAYRVQSGKNMGGRAYADGGEVDPWAQGVRAAETGAIAPSPYRNSDMDAMINIGRAGDTLKKNAPLLMDTGPGRVAQAVGRFASGNSPYAAPGLRREDYSDDPEARQPIEPMVNDAMNVADVMSMGSLPSVALKGVERGALGVGVPPKAAVHPDVPALKSKLEAALQSKDKMEFPAIFESLKEMPIEVLKPLAKEFYGGAAARSKNQALETIWSRWRKLREFADQSTSANRPSFAEGGSVPFFARQGASQLAHSGMIHSNVPGRTDRLPMGVKRNSYVIPADVVSAAGQGNSSAGANAFNHMFKTGPYGSSLPHIQIAKAIRQKFADGGEVDKPVDIIAAGGEFVVPPEAIERVGGGDMNRGHDILDRMVHHIRKKTIKTLRKLPGPKSS